MKDKEEKIKASVLRGMEQDRLKLLTRQPFIGTVLMHLEMIPITHGCSTAQTDGRAVYMNCHFYAGLDLEERLFVLAHETWHCVLLHFVRKQSRTQHGFNIACDLEIHFILMKERMKEPFVLPHDPAWDGLSAEEIYEKFKHRNPKKMTPPKCSKGIQPGKDGGSFDDHIYKQPSTEQPDSPSKGSQDSESGISGKDSSGNESGANEKTIDDSTIEKIRRIVIQSAQMVERQRGHLPEHIRGIIARLQKPELNWKELLKQFVTSAYGGTRRWLPPARRYIGMGLYLQSRRSERLEAVLAIDTSGSTTGDQPQFFTELANLLNTFGFYQLTVIQCDCTIQKVETFSDAKPLPRNYQWESLGLGGTSFIPPFDYIREKKLRPQIMIYLTDGYGPAPDKSSEFPVLWVLTHDGKKPAPWGRAIKLKGDANEPK